MRVDREVLLNALHIASKCLEKKNTIPGLNSFKLTMEDELTIDATDLDRTIRIPIQAEGEPFSLLVDGKLLTNVIEKLPVEAVELSVKDDKLLVKKDKGSIKLNTSPANIFPNIQYVAEKYVVSFPTSEFAEVCKSILMAANDNHIDAFTSVANFEITRNLGEGHFNCTATDKHRIAFISGLCETEETEPFSFQLPLTAVRTLQPTLKYADKIEFGEDKNHIFAKVGESYYSFRKVSLTYPDLSSYKAKTIFDRSMLVDAGEITRSFELVGQVLDPRLSRIGMTLNGDIELSTASENGSISDTVEAEIDFEGFTTGYNFNYIVPILKQTEGEIALQFAREERKTGDTYPIRISYTRQNVNSSFDIGAMSDMGAK